eukprot:scaffold246590_cov28-Tisochrysis_lutea.AAC.2
MAGPSKLTTPPAPKTYPMSRACPSSPPFSAQIGPKIEFHPLPPPKKKKRTASASGRLVQKAKAIEPKQTPSIDPMRAGRRPARSATYPHGTDVGSRPRGSIVASKPATNPAWSSESTHPASTVRKPAYEKMEHML